MPWGVASEKEESDGEAGAGVQVGRRGLNWDRRWGVGQKQKKPLSGKRPGCTGGIYEGWEKSPAPRPQHCAGKELRRHRTVP